MVEFHYDKCYGRHNVQLPYELGDMKDMKTVAHIEDGKIFFTKELTVSMVRAIIKAWDKKTKRDNSTSKKEQEFELYPDGENHV